MDNKSLVSRYIDVHEALFSWTFTVVRSTWTFPCLCLTELIRSLSAFAIPVGSQSGMVLSFKPRTRSSLRRLKRRQEEDLARDAARNESGWVGATPGENWQVFRADTELSTRSVSPRKFDSLRPIDEGS
jgi:hypothetical protein